jgi:DNA-binding transcriptional ArsR family regulator
MSNWTEERVETLMEIVGDATPVTQETVAEAAEALDVSTRSVASKLRKMGVEVEKVGERAKAFSDEEAEALREFVTAHAGEFTYGEIAEQFMGGAFSARQIQGKVLSMELTEAVKPTPKKESVKTYSEDDESTFVKLARAGAFLEDIAETLGRSLNSVRGKALSLLRLGTLESIPAQKQSYAANREDPFEALGDISEMTVEEIAEKVGKSVRGVKTMITHRGLACANYKAKARKADKEAA